MWGTPQRTRKPKALRRATGLLPFFRSHAQAKLAAFPEAGEHEADGTSFERDAEFCDAELLALALRSCLRSGIDPSKLDQCFVDQFGIAEIWASLAHFKESCSACG